LKVKRPVVVKVHRDSMAVVAKYLGEGPLYFVDGKAAPADTLKMMNPNSIESITVLKDSANIEKYGEKARNGVILIKMKHPGGFNATPGGQAGN
jgi:hypothetical protein